MELHTIQMSAWRVAKDLGIHFIDTTVKSGDSVFAPTWDIVMNVKSGVISEETYTYEYQRLMRNSFKVNRWRWVEVCEMQKVAIACYCTPGKFCHRHLLAGYLQRTCSMLEIPFVLKGELSRR